MERQEPEIVLPKQETFFSTEKPKRSARAGTNMPAPAMAPYGYVPEARFNHLFLLGRLHPDEHVSFGFRSCNWSHVCQPQP